MRYSSSPERSTALGHRAGSRESMPSCVRTKQRALPPSWWSLRSSVRWRGGSLTSSGVRACASCVLPCTLRRSRHLGHTHVERLGPGAPAAHDNDRLPLLPSGSDGVRGPPLHRTRSSTPRHARCDRDAGPREGIQPRWSGLRVQGTASSPPSTALRWYEKVRAAERAGFEPASLSATRFPSGRTRPLCDLSPLRGDFLAVRPYSLNSPGPRVAERAGFEPARLSPTAFRERHHQPLGHLSTSKSTVAWARPTRGTDQHSAENFP